MVYLDPLLERATLRVGAVPTIGEAGGVENMGTEAVEDIEAIAVGKR
jgi:hypothetical protein